MNYKNVGFFYELSQENQKKILQKIRRKEPHKNEEEILKYLNSGVEIGVTTILEHDVLCYPTKLIGESILLTDGEWLWPSSLIYFTREYHLELPVEFLEKMEKNYWRISSTAKNNSILPEGYIKM
ncbi:MAG: hypothetical protein GY714_16125 [Desulfobacterales bacterium]|nr:hypothetical protein [Desulfobacterales bacterium]